MPYFDILVRFVNEDDRGTAGNPATSGDFVNLEQIPPEEPKASGFQNWYRESYGDSSTSSWEQMMMAFEAYKSRDCTGGFLTVEIHAHKSRSDLQYKMEASRGTWQPSASETERKKDSVDITNSSSYVFTNENVVSIICAEWEGDVFNQFNEKILPKPAISVSVYNPSNVDDKRVHLVFGKKCSGTIRIVKDIEYDVWNLLIDPRTLTTGAGSTSGQGAISISSPADPTIWTPEGVGLSQTTGVDGNSCSTYYDSDDLKGAYASSVRAVWDGGMDRLEIKLSEDEELSQNCNPYDDLFGLQPGSTGIDPDDPDPDDHDPDGNCYDLYVTRDKCTNEILKEELVSVGCSDEE